MYVLVRAFVLAEAAFTFFDQKEFRVVVVVVFYVVCRSLLGFSSDFVQHCSQAAAEIILFLE